MRIARLTDYAFVLLTVLGRQKLASAPVLAEMSGLGEPTVAKILKFLAHAGIVNAARGATGGYSLAKPLEDINVASVIEAMEGPIAFTRCTQEKTYDCACGDQCDKQAAWVDVNTMVRDALANISLAQMERQAS